MTSLNVSKGKKPSKNDCYEIVRESLFEKRNLADFETYEMAYHQLMLDIVGQQILSTQLVIHNSPVKKLFVDGGFSKNSIFMNLLAEAFPDLEVYAASMAQASALGKRSQDFARKYYSWPTFLEKSRQIHEEFMSLVQ